MSTIQAVAFRRNQLPSVRDAVPHIGGPGVYILIGDDEKETDRQLAYIGESEDVRARLSYYKSEEKGSDSKPFWTDTLALISKDENLTKGHARYVESCLIGSVDKGNPRWSLLNTKEPSDDAGKLPLPQRLAMDEFVDQTKTLVGTLGWDLFRDMRGRAAETAALVHDPLQRLTTDNPRFFFKGVGYEAEMEVGKSGYFVVKHQSRARLQTTDSVPPRAAALRKTLEEKGVLKEDGESLVFTSDYNFSSASAAAAVVCGTSVNGRSSWKLRDERTYATWEAEQEKASRPSSQAQETGAT